MPKSNDSFSLEEWFHNSLTLRRTRHGSYRCEHGPLLVMEEVKVPTKAERCGAVRGGGSESDVFRQRLHKCMSGGHDTGRCFCQCCCYVRFCCCCSKTVRRVIVYCRPCAAGVGAFMVVATTLPPRVVGADLVRSPTLFDCHWRNYPVVDWMSILYEKARCLLSMAVVVYCGLQSRASFGSLSDAPATRVASAVEVRVSWMEINASIPRALDDSVRCHAE